MKGRKPKVQSIAANDGNTGHRKPRNAPSVAGDFDPPFELGEVAMKEWERIRLEAKWIQAPSAWLLAERCQAFEDLQKARADIRRRGRLRKTRNGSVKNPSLQMEREYRTFILRADVELGLTPCSQQKVSAPSSPTVNPIEAALCG